MSGMILCRSEYSRRPYYIEGAGINVYSIEEISYFLYNDIYLVGADFFCEELFVFIERDIKEPQLAKRLRYLKEQKAGLSELVLMILRYVDFYSEEEITQLGSLIERLDTGNPWERLKARADNYLVNRRYSNAISNYEEIISGSHDLSLGEEFYGNVWHNMGTAYAGMYDFTMACECFGQAVELNHNENTKKCYYYASQLMHAGEDNGEYKEQGEKSVEGVITEEEDDVRAEGEALMYEAVRELEVCLDSAAANESYLAVAEVLKDKEQGRIADYYNGVDKLVRAWKDEYRRTTG